MRIALAGCLLRLTISHRRLLLRILGSAVLLGSRRSRILLLWSVLLRRLFLVGLLWDLLWNLLLLITVLLLLLRSVALLRRAVILL